MYATVKNLFFWNNNSEDVDIEWMERYQKLTWMGFAEDEALVAAQKYKNVEQCVQHLTKDECMDNEDNVSYNIQSIVRSAFKMIYDAEKDDDNNNNDVDGIDSDILCKCGAKMQLKDPVKCYNDTNYLYVICDECDEKCMESSKVYHCPKSQIEQHPDGYDVCQQCIFKCIDKKINIINNKHDEKKQSEMIIDMKTNIKKKIIKRALIIQTLSNGENYECEDADALSKLFTSLGYQVTIISPDKATKENIDNALDKLYKSDENKGAQTFTTICYSGHGIRYNDNDEDINNDTIKRDTFYFCLENGEHYSSEDLYKKINMNLFGSIQDGFIRMMAGNDATNETLLIINACHSGGLQKQLKEQEQNKKCVSIWRNKKLWILVAFAAVTAVCYLVSKRDKSYETTETAKDAVKDIISDEIASIEQPAVEMKEEIDTKTENENGMDYAEDLMERELGDSVDIDWKDLKNDLKNRWNRIKIWGKGKITEQQFVEKVVKKLIKEAPKQKHTSDAAISNNVSIDMSEAVISDHEMKAPEQQSTAVAENTMDSIILDDPTSRETWIYLARNLKECAWDQLMKNTASVCGPVYGALISGSFIMKSWMKSKRANGVNIMASCKKDEESNFTLGISPFVRYVIDAISDMEIANAEKLDIDKLYESVAYDASNKILCGGVTLHDIDQHPVIHHTKN